MTPWTAALQVALSIGSPRQEYCSGLPFSSPGDLPDPGIELTSPTLQAGSLLLSHQGNPSFSNTTIYKTVEHFATHTHTHTYLLLIHVKKILQMSGTNFKSLLDFI